MKIEVSGSRVRIPDQYLEPVSRAAKPPGCARWMLFCIRMIVQVIDSGHYSLLFRAASWVVAGMGIAIFTSCSLFSGRDGSTIRYDLPLTVQLRSDPSIAGAQLTYQDACGQRQSLPISAPLQELLERKTGRVFEKVLVGETRSSSAPDGSVDVALGLAHADLAIPRKGNKSYPATVTLGLDFAYTRCGWDDPLQQEDSKHWPWSGRGHRGVV